jgi:hypothetical protein
VTDELDGEGSGGLGALVSQVVADATRLMRQEVELARAEIRAEATKAVNGVASLVIGVVALHMVAIAVTVGGVLALTQAVAEHVPELAEWAAAIAAATAALAWLVVGLILVGSGRRRLRHLSPIPRQTIQSIREDISWLRRRSS